MGVIVQSIMAKLEAMPKLTEAELADREKLRQEQIDESARQMKRERWHCLVSQIGQRYAAATFDTFEVKCEAQGEVLGLLADFTQRLDEAINAGRNVVLFGPPGTGKDHLLASLMREAIRNNWTVEWRDGQSLYGQFRDAIDTETTEASMLLKLTKASVLGISDPTPPLGAVSDYQRSMLFRIIDRRYRDLRPTWVTINASSAEEASQRISPNIIDRLTHGALILRCNWASYRRNN